MARKSTARSMRDLPKNASLTNLEIFVLAAIQAGLDSAYDLNKYADLSVGTTIPLLRRLESARLVRSKAAARQSNQYVLATPGRSILQRSWRRILSEVPRDFESILRVVYLSATRDRRLKGTRQFLKLAAADRERLANQRERHLGTIEREKTYADFGQGYRWLRTHSASVRLREEARLLLGLSTRKDLAQVLRPSNRRP